MREPQGRKGDSPRRETAYKMGEKMADDIPDKGLVARIYKETQKLNSKK